MKILVIDGQGGRLGGQLVKSISTALPDAELIAIGTNTIATECMLKAGARAAATGENAVIVNCRTADVIAGPLGIAMADSLLGEITPAMANAVAASNAMRVLIPMNLCSTYVAGVNNSVSAMIEDAVAHMKALALKG